jgi:hypothetical protein
VSWNWDEITKNTEVSYKPRILIFIESFERKYKGTMPDDLLTKAACLAVALYLFGPLETDELNAHAVMIHERIEKYRQSIN